MKQRLLTSVSAIAVAAGTAWLMRYRRAPRAASAGGRSFVAPVHRGDADPSPGQADSAEITRSFLLYFIVPLWTAAGVADWLCHRASHIEETSGTKESLLHLAMLIEAGIPVIAGMFLEINSWVFALMLASFLLHEATALWDVAYAVTLREVTPIEQHVHSFLELVPLMAISLVAILHWPQFLALFGRGREKAEHRFAAKQRPLPTGYVAAVTTALIGLEAVPYVEELLRGLAREQEAGRRRYGSSSCKCMHA